MKWIFISSAVILAFVLGLYVGQRQTVLPNISGLQGKFADIANKDVKNYDSLNEQKLKYDQANEILAKVLQLFLVDLGLRVSGTNECKIADGPKPLDHTAKVNEDGAASEEKAKPKAIENNENTSGKVSESESKSSADKKATSSEDGPILVEEEKSKGAVHALYQAILWRAPDPGGGAEATKRFSREGWHQYIQNAKAMVQSPEFLKEIEPQYTSQEIINRMYAVFLGRCASRTEMRGHLRSLKSQGPPRIVGDIISNARQANTDKIFEGGYSPSSCADL